MSTTPRPDTTGPHPPKFLDRFRDARLIRGFTPPDADADVGWARRFILFHGKRHPDQMGGSELGAFLTRLAADRAALHDQARARHALLFVYRDFHHRDPGPVPVAWPDLAAAGGGRRGDSPESFRATRAREPIARRTTGLAAVHHAGPVGRATRIAAGTRPELPPPGCHHCVEGGAPRPAHHSPVTAGGQSSSRSSPLGRGAVPVPTGTQLMTRPDPDAVRATFAAARAELAAALKHQKKRTKALRQAVESLRGLPHFDT